MLGKLLILGGSGLLGSEWVAALKSAKLDFVVPTRAELDVTNFPALASYIEDLDPGVIINCTGFNAVDDAEIKAEAQLQADLLNVEVPQELARIALKQRCKLVQYSSDYVFAGEKKDGYVEADATAPLNYYGKTKLAAEEAVTAEIYQGLTAYIVRTAWLYGGRPVGKHGHFVGTMLKLADQHQELRIVNDQTGCPTYAADVVSGTLKLLRSSAQAGIYHLVNQGACSWAEFAKKIFALSGKDVSVRPVSSAEYQRPAVRPQNSVLLQTKGPQMRSWQEALTDYLT